ncbi:hypothetical protein SADUNF_Sadunf14G0071300 [Salix dunnii]|uniref:Uncharacterized protein n=1 Tax=Salix dunnii TaxID=1413687 RepID=A0A835JG66_9ROSI|nr:hypothetical protein SADUNF_Sadunf14G0071300 [Salix dunnii]
MLSGRVMKVENKRKSVLAYSDWEIDPRETFIEELAEKLRGTLAVYHPEALIMNIYSGNGCCLIQAIPGMFRRSETCIWSVKHHLVEYLTSGCAAEKRYDSASYSNIVPRIILSDYFEGSLLEDSSSTDKGFQRSADAR